VTLKKAKTDRVVAALRKIQQTVRTAGQKSADEVVRTQRVSGTSGPTARYVTFDAAARDAVGRAAALLAADERFEHMKQPAEAVWDLARRVAVDPASDLVAEFVAEHERPVLALRCFVPVEHLVTRQRWRADGMEFLPVGDGEVPDPGGWFRLDEPIGTVAVADVIGTSLERMAHRARERVSAALTVVRLALLAGQLGVADEQLRFRVGEAYAFGDGITGWRRRDDVASNLDVGPDLGAVLAARPVGGLLDSNRQDIAAAARLAAGWLDRAAFAADPLVDVLFSFFALEAILGRKSDRLKGDSLAVRRMTLDHDRTGGFGHPNRLWLLYDEVRSAAVHGSRPSDVDERDAHQFRHDVAIAIEQVLQFAVAHGLTRRDRLLDALDAHPDLPRLADWLIANGGADWQPYIDGLPGSSTADPATSATDEDGSSC